MRINKAKEIFQYNLPKRLREKPPQQDADKEKTSKLDKDVVESKTDQKEGTEEKGETKKDTTFDPSGTELDKGDEEVKKSDLIKKKQLEKELEQVIYISISETPTNILFYCPSTKYLTNKNGKLLYIYI